MNIALTPNQLVCQIHREPFKLLWPRGFDQYAQLATEYLQDCRWFVDGCEDTVVAIQARCNTKPVCCWLKPDQLANLYGDVNKACEVAFGGPLWQPGYCSHCGARNALGAPFLPLYTHLCLGCHASQHREGA